MTDNETKTIGIQKFTNVDATNRVYLNQVISELEGKSRGSWVLVRAHDKADGCDKLKREHDKKEKKGKIKCRIDELFPNSELNSLMEQRMTA